MQMRFENETGCFLSFSMSFYVFHMTCVSVSMLNKSLPVVLSYLTLYIHCVSIKSSPFLFL